MYILCVCRDTLDHAGRAVCSERTSEPLTMLRNIGGACTVFVKQSQADTHPLRVIDERAIMLSQLRTQHLPRKLHLVRLFREVPAMTTDIDVSSWGHHYRTYSKMVDRLAYIAMNIGTSLQGHASSDQSVVKEAMTFLDNYVNHWLETSHTEDHVLQGPALMPRNLITTRQDSVRRRSDVRRLVLPSK